MRVLFLSCLMILRSGCAPVSTLVRIPTLNPLISEKLKSLSSRPAYLPPPTNDEVLLHRIAQVNHNTKVKLIKFPANHTKHMDYQLLLDAPRVCERPGMKTRVVELGSLPVLAPQLLLCQRHRNFQLGLCGDPDQRAVHFGPTVKGLC